MIATTDGLKAEMAIEPGGIRIIINGKDHEQLFDNCLLWASTNISGEFRFEIVKSESSENGSV